MNKNLPSNQDPILAITQFLSYDFIQDEIQAMPSDLQNIFDLVLETEAGNNLETRLKMLRIKYLITQYAKTFEAFSEAQIQNACEKYKKK
jgi:hypothetical protein